MAFRLLLKFVNSCILIRDFPCVVEIEILLFPNLGHVQLYYAFVPTSKVVAWSYGQKMTKVYKILDFRAVVYNRRRLFWSVKRWFTINAEVTIDAEVQ